MDREALIACIDACSDCAQACTACADACLAEAQVQTLIRCIRLDLDCADICAATMRVLSRQTAFDATLARSRCKPAPRRVVSAAMSASNMRSMAWSIAASALRHAVAASRPANECFPRSRHEVHSARRLGLSERVKDLTRRHPARSC
jgi:hypothetical protein